MPSRLEFESVGRMIYPSVDPIKSDENALDPVDRSERNCDYFRFGRLANAHGRSFNHKYARYNTVCGQTIAVSYSTRGNAFPPSVSRTCRIDRKRSRCRGVRCASAPSRKSAKTNSRPACCFVCPCAFIYRFEIQTAPV